jgi:phosphoribosylamine--glycine ligase
MKLLVIGSGGREHALAWRLAKTPGLQKVFVAPGNAGTAGERELENVNLTDAEALADFASRQKVQLTIVGPEAPLAAGIVNLFRARGLKIFGPTREAAQLESSKDFAKRFMARHMTFRPRASRASSIVPPRTPTSTSRAPRSSSRPMASRPARGWSSP